MLTAAGSAVAAPPAAVPTTRPATVEFLAGDAARDAIVDDHLDPYFDRLRPTEMSMKTGEPITGDTPAAQRAECVKRYRAAVRDFTDDEKQALTFFVEKVRPALARDYPVFGDQPFSFVKVADTLEGGMPHTRGPHVVMPEDVLANFGRMRRLGGDRATPGVVGLLVHEQTHVLQRLHPDLFEPLYTKTYGFVRAKRIDPGPWLDARQLVNPDGTVCDWVLPVTEHGKRTVILPLVAFEDDHPTSMRGGMGTIAVTMEPTGTDGEYRPAANADGTPVVRPLDGVAAYTAVAGRGGDNYHPNEIAADAFSRLIVVDHLIDKSKLPADRAAKLEATVKPTRDWARAAFAAKT